MNPAGREPDSRSKVQGVPPYSGHGDRLRGVRPAVPEPSASARRQLPAPAQRLPHLRYIPRRGLLYAPGRLRGYARRIRCLCLH